MKASKAAAQTTFRSRIGPVSVCAEVEGELFASLCGV